MPRHKVPNIEESGGIKPQIDKYSKDNFGLGYKHWRFFRERGVNTTNLAKIFGKVWETARNWETLDDKENGKPASKK